MAAADRSPWVCTDTISACRPSSAITVAAIRPDCANASALPRVPRRRMRSAIVVLLLEGERGSGDGCGGRTIEAEELVQRLRVRQPLGCVGELLHPDGRRVQELVDDPPDG